MTKGLAQILRFGALALVVSGLAFVSAHQLRGGKTLKVSVQMRGLPEPVQQWVYVARGPHEPDIAVTGTYVIAHFANKIWKPISRVDSSLVAVEASSGGKVVAILRYTQRPAPGRPGVLLLNVLDFSGRPKASWSLPWEYDRPAPAIALAHDGSLVALGWADVGIVQYFRSGNTEPATIDLFPNDEYGYERNLYLARDDSTDQFLVLATERGVNPTAENPNDRSAKARLFWLDAEGHIVQSAAIEAEGIAAFHFDEHARLIAIGGTDFPAPDRPLPFAEIRSAEGGILTRVEHIVPERFALSSDQRLGVLADPHQIVVADLVQRLELWRYTTATNGRSILDVAIAEKPEAVAFLSAVVAFQNSGFVYRDPKVSLVTTNGKNLGETDLPEPISAKALLAPGPEGGLRVLAQDRIWIISLAQ